MRAIFLLLLALGIGAALWALGCEKNTPSADSGLQTRYPPPVADPSPRGDTAGMPSASPTLASTPAGSQRGSHSARLAPLASVCGRVIDASGAPVPNVPIFTARALSRFDHADEAPLLSGAAGTYRLTDLAPGEVTIFVFGAGWISAALSTVDLDEDYNPLRIVVSAGAPLQHDLRVAAAGHIRGVVRDTAGAPLVGAEVNASEVGQNIGFCGNAPVTHAFGFVSAPPAVKTDDRGRYAIPSVIPGIEYSVQASHVGFGLSSDSTRARSGATTEVNLTLGRIVEQAPWSLRVRVLEAESGRPIEAAEVTGAGLLETDSAGWARYDGVRAEAVRVGVSAGGYFGNDLHVAAPAVDATDPLLTVEVRLLRASSVAGMVLLPDGSPAKQAQVILGKTSGYGLGGRNTYTDVDGRFRFALLHPESDAQQLRVALFQEGRRYGGEVNVQPGETELRIQLIKTEHNPALTPRDLRVVGPDGTPVPSARVFVRSLQPNEYTGGKLYLASQRTLVRDGALRLEIEYVPFWIEIYGATAAPDSRPGTLLCGPFQSTSDVDAVLTLPTGGRVEGQVMDTNGDPIQGVGVTIVGGYAVLAPHKASGTRHGKTHSDTRGRFSFDGLGDCAYQVTVSTPSRWLAPEPQDTRAGSDALVFRLTETTEVAITVLDEAGAPIAGCLVHAYVGDEGVFPFLRGGIKGDTFADGRVTLRGLRPEQHYTLQVSAPYGRDDLLPATSRDWSPADETQVTLRAAATLQGQVVDQEGRGLSHAHVSLMREGTRRGPGATTDAGGHFRLTGLEPGPARLFVRHGPFRPESKHAVLAPRTSLRLVHDGGAALLVAPPNPPAKGTPYEWRLASGPAGNTLTQWASKGQWDGPLALPGLADGERYALYLYIPSENRALYLPAVTSASGTLQAPLARAHEMRGRILLSDGKAPFEGGWVEVSGPAFERTVRAGPDGRFVVTGLPAGQWRLKASAWRNLDEYEGSRSARTGESVDVRLDRQGD